MTFKDEKILSDKKFYCNITPLDSNIYEQTDNDINYSSSDIHDWISEFEFFKIMYEIFFTKKIKKIFF